MYDYAINYHINNIDWLYVKSKIGHIPDKQTFTEVYYEYECDLDYTINSYLNYQKITEV